MVNKTCISIISKCNHKVEEFRLSWLRIDNRKEQSFSQRHEKANPKKY